MLKEEWFETYFNTKFAIYMLFKVWNLFPLFNIKKYNHLRIVYIKFSGFFIIFLPYSGSC